MNAHVEQLEFQAETRQLLDLMVHSVYSNKDSFLRELVSNASDALDKLRLEAFRDKDLDVDTSDLHIEIEVDKQARTLTVRDNGIGMSREEVVDLIGTLARSGTADLRRKLREAKDAAAAGALGASEELIGQFGIGFYSTFMVADKVTLLTRRAGQSQATRWESSGEGTYTIETVDDAPQGSSVTLHLKPEDAEDHLHDYTSEYKIKELVKRYSDFIAWPIRMDVARSVPGEDGAEATVTVESETINSMKALWARSKDEVSDEEYQEFYRHIAHAWDEPLETIAMKAEGTFEYQALLFIPTHAPFDLFQRDAKTGVQLYVKRVFIMDDCDQLIPSTCASSRVWWTHRTSRSTSRARSCSRTARSGPSGAGSPRRCCPPSRTSRPNAPRTTAPCGPSSVACSRRACCPTRTIAMRCWASRRSRPPTARTSRPRWTTTSRV
ncbi:histidine kinase-, DNA gyrase B-, and HSP90-like ATPase family protein [Rhodococcus sp. MTM3W5.2]|nr:histidine kinase-, DNA gyrase B-, and HSP90-like ATPase family protein [Rhodococcus sp. MTM3W5.2]